MLWDPNHPLDINNAPRRVDILRCSCACSACCCCCRYCSWILVVVVELLSCCCCCCCCHLGSTRLGQAWTRRGAARLAISLVCNFNDKQIAPSCVRFQFLFRLLRCVCVCAVCSVCVCILCVCALARGAPFERTLIEHKRSLTRQNTLNYLTICESPGTCECAISLASFPPLYSFPHCPLTHVCKVIVVHGGAPLGQRLCVLVGGAREEVIAHRASNLMLILESRIAFPAGVLQIKDGRFYINIKKKWKQILIK